MLVPKEDLEQFNDMVKPVEEEAYDILKRRSRTLENWNMNTDFILFYCCLYVCVPSTELVILITVKQ